MLTEKKSILFLLLLSWSAFVQFVGAFAYDIGGWENRTSIELKLKNTDKVFVLGEYETQNLEINPDNIVYAKKHSYSIDRARYRHRLWSFNDSPIPFYIYFFTQARHAKIRHSNEYLESIGKIN